MSERLLLACETRRKSFQNVMLDGCRDFMHVPDEYVHIVAFSICWKLEGWILKLFLNNPVWSMLSL